MNNTVALAITRFSAVMRSAVNCLRNKTDSGGEKTTGADSHFYHQLLDSLPILVWSTRPDGWCDFVSPQWCEYSGRPAADAAGERWLELVQAEEREQVAAAWRQSVEQGADYETTLRLRRKDGEYRWFQARAKPVRGGDGGTIRWFGSCTDIHEQKAIAEALRQSRERLRDVIAATSAGYYEHSPDFTHGRISTRFAEIFGAEIKTLPGFPELGKWISSHVDAEDFSRVNHAYGRFLNGEIPSYEDEFRIRTVEGDVRWVRVVNAGIRRQADGRVSYLAGLIFDISNRKQIEEAAARHRRRLELLAEAARMLLAGEDPDNMVGNVFQLFASDLDLDVFLNYSVSEAGNELILERSSGLTVEQMQQFNRLKFGEAVCGMVAANRKCVNVCSVLEDRSAETAPLREIGVRAYACNPLIVQDRLFGTLGFGSKRRDGFSAEELSFFKTIAHYVAIAKERLAYERVLKEADRRKDQFLATLAHELRNPLAPIRTAVQLMKKPDTYSAVLQEARAIAERQLEHLVRLVDDLLDLSRVTRGKIDLRKRIVPLREVVDSALETSRPQIERQRHHLSLSIAEEPAAVEGDPVRLAQGISNLLVNAAKYTPEGGHISLRVSSERGSAVIEVEDDGIGIDSQEIPRIFDMFTQVGHSLNHRADGLGIGLALTRMLITMHGGTVEARSEGPGKGSTFTIRLPLAAPAGRGEAVLQACPSEHKVRRVLVVDDNADAANLLAAMLQGMGYQAAAVHSGPEAIQRAKNEHSEVVLLDIGMPGMNGYEVAKKLKSDKETQQAVLVALTGWGQEEDKEQARRAGFRHNLVKPADIEQISQILDEA